MHAHTSTHAHKIKFCFSFHQLNYIGKALVNSKIQRKILVQYGMPLY